MRTFRGFKAIFGQIHSMLEDQIFDPVLKLYIIPAIADSQCIDYFSCKYLSLTQDLQSEYGY